MIFLDQTRGSRKNAIKLHQKSSLLSDISMQGLKTCLHGSQEVQFKACLRMCAQGATSWSSDDNRTTLAEQSAD